MMRTIQLAAACVAVIVAGIGQVEAGVMASNGITADLGGRHDRSDFKLVLRSLDRSHSSGQNFGWMIWGDAFPAPRPIPNFTPLSGRFPNSHLSFCLAPGGHSGASWIANSPSIISGWGPIGAGHFVTWQCTSSPSITSGWLFSNLFGCGVLSHIESENSFGSANPVPEPSSLAIFGFAACMAGVGARRRRRLKRHDAAE
ncbi:PEP-CTERM motif protein [Rubripirellula lacrimiformis]|uniref:PEP-CTERM motif protein n=1 Tax=Rubripirellula lacrimiformis TaxID=1930273 RepID=A0A517NGJ1_9BACT|nr:PEP-CTERM motif protein [Rubripirellula lacrimiformis]